MQLTPFFKLLSLIHGSLLMGLVGFGVMAYSVNPGFRTEIYPNDMFIYVVPIAAALGYFGSTYLFQKFVRRIRQEDALKIKMGAYQKALIVKYALIEGATILALIAYYLHANVFHLVIAICLMVYLFSQRPTKKDIFKNLKLSLDEQKGFQQNDQKSI